MKLLQSTPLLISLLLLLQGLINSQGDDTGTDNEIVVESGADIVVESGADMVGESEAGTVGETGDGADEEGLYYEDEDGDEEVEEFVTGKNYTFLVTMNVEPHGDLEEPLCDDTRLELEQNITTYNMTMIMMDDIAETLPNQTVYIEEFADYLKCPTYPCDYGKRCTIYCSEVVVVYDENDLTNAYKNLTANSFDMVKVNILDDHRSMIDNDIIICNGKSGRFMIQYYVSWPTKSELYEHTPTNKTSIVKGADEENEEEVSPQMT